MATKRKKFMTPEDVKLSSADEFLTKDSQSFMRTYVFPFVALDPTPGGSNLGRIMFNMELVPGRKRRDGRYYYEQMMIQVRQTRDPKYLGKTFSIPILTESLYSSQAGPNRSDFTKYVWHIEQCPVHKVTCMSAYPENHHTKLKIVVGSSIMIEAYFE